MRSPSVRATTGGQKSHATFRGQLKLQIPKRIRLDRHTRGLSSRAREPDGDACSFHTGWPEDNKHWRISCYCWAMYLRLLRRYLEYGEIVPYERRLEV